MLSAVFFELSESQLADKGYQLERLEGIFSLPAPLTCLWGLCCVSLVLSLPWHTSECLCLQWGGQTLAASHSLMSFLQRPSGNQAMSQLVLICMSLMTSDIAYLFIRFLDICVSSFGEMSMQVLCPFFTLESLLVWGALSYRSSLYINLRTYMHVCITHEHRR